MLTMPARGQSAMVADATPAAAFCCRLMGVGFVERGKNKPSCPPRIPGRDSAPDRGVTSGDFSRQHASAEWRGNSGPSRSCKQPARRNYITSRGSMHVVGWSRTSAAKEAQVGELRSSSETGHGAGFVRRPEYRDTHEGEATRMLCSTHRVVPSEAD